MKNQCTRPRSLMWLSVFMLFLMFFVSSLSAQTKTETEAWILAKLRDNSLWYMQSSQFDGYSWNTFGTAFQYSIINGKLSVTYIETSSKTSTIIQGESWDKEKVAVKLDTPTRL